MVEYPETEDQKGKEKTREGKAEEQRKSEGTDSTQYTSIQKNEGCKSCLDMPEEQRKTMILEIQKVAENVLKTHGVVAELKDLLKGEWFLKLQKPGFEKKLVLAKSGEEVFVGYYSYSDDVPIPDPNLVLLSQNGFWYPQRIEEKYEETVASFFTGAYGDYDFLNILPENLEKFQTFQKDFAKTLESQNWTGSDVEIVDKIMPKD